MIRHFLYWVRAPRDPVKLPEADLPPEVREASHRLNNEIAALQGLVHAIRRQENWHNQHGTRR